MASTEDNEKTVADETVMMSPEELPTTMMPESPAPSVDPAPAAGPAPVTGPAPAPNPVSDLTAPDGIDALDDPYFSPVVPEDLTTAHQPVSIPSPVESLPERKRRLPCWGIALIVVVLLAAAGAVACLTYERELWGGKTIPNVVGMSADQAEGALTDLGFGVDVAYQAADENLGVVVSCDPVPGIRTDLSETVTITVTAERVIPSVVGMNVDDATHALAEAGAANVSLTYLNSEQESGTVLDVSPGEGSSFVSSDQVTLTVAQAYTVPNVAGMTTEEALAALERDGLAGSVTYVESDAERGTVVAANPDVGSEVSAGSTVELSVSSIYPSSPTSLLEYFEVESTDLATYLDDEGYTLRYGATFAAGGNAHAAYEGKGGDVLQITDAPETGSYEGDSKADVLARGAGVGGVRYAFAAASVPEGGSVESEKGLRAVMEACGLTGLRNTCTQEDAEAPNELRESEAFKDAHFICGSGVQGGYTWAVLIGGTGSSTHVVALVAPSRHFSELDLSDYGGDVCDYVACTDLFAAMLRGDAHE